MDKNILKDLSYGLYVVGAMNEDKKVGCIANSVVQITSVNPQIIVSLNKDNFTTLSIQKSGKFSISILSEKTEAMVISKMGFQSSKDNDKYEDLKFDMVDELPIVEEDICGYLICEAKKFIDVGTHILIIAKINDMKRMSNNQPMTYEYYHRVIKGKAPKAVPPYIEEKEVGYVCDICGYVHKGEMSLDFVCPICGADYTHFIASKTL